jgi:hypothetical protein
MGERFTAESRGPVVLIHLGTDGASHLAACSGQPHENLAEGLFPMFVRVICQGCLRRGES